MAPQHPRRWLNDAGTDAIAALFEFMGTCVFLILSLGTAQSVTYLNKTKNPGADMSNTADFIYIACGFGFALLVSAWLFFRVTGALFNPNIATALLIVGAINPFRWLLFVIAHLIGAICAAAVVQGLMPGSIAGLNTIPNPMINKAQALFIEMFVTAFLTFAVLMLAVEKHRSTPFAPIGVGITLFVCELWSIPLTGGSVNTARSFGPAVVTSFHHTHWIYWLGPTMGALLASAVYIFAKRQQYWTLAPHQDTTDEEKSPANIPLARKSDARRSEAADPSSRAENGIAGVPSHHSSHHSAIERRD